MPVPLPSKGKTIGVVISSACFITAALGGNVSCEANHLSHGCVSRSECHVGTVLVNYLDLVIVLPATGTMGKYILVVILVA